MPCGITENLKEPIIYAAFTVYLLIKPFFLHVYNKSLLLKRDNSLIKFLSRQSQEKKGVTISLHHWHSKKY